MVDTAAQAPTQGAPGLNLSVPSLAGIGNSGDIGAAHTEVANYIKMAQAQAGANAKVLQTQMNTAAQAKQVDLQAQNAAQVKADNDAVEDQQRKAAVLKLLTDQFGGDATDSNSVIARNNQAIAETSRQMLNQWDAINMVDQSTGVEGMLARAIALPQLSGGFDALKSAHDTLTQNNADIQNALTTESQRMFGAIDVNDTDRAVQTNAATAAKAMATMAQDSFQSGQQQLVAANMTSQTAIDSAKSIAAEQERAILAPIQEAIGKDQLADLDSTKNAMEMISSNTGMPIEGKGGIRALRWALSSNPQAWNAFIKWGVTGKLDNPSDYLLFKNFIPSTTPNGQPNPAYAAVQQVSQLEPRISKEEGEFQTWLGQQPDLMHNPMQLAKVLANPAVAPEYRQKFNEQVLSKQPIPYLAVNKNPAAMVTLMQQHAADYGFSPDFLTKIPAVAAWVAKQGDKSIDVKPENFIKQVVLSNPDVPAEQLGKQVALYYNYAKTAEDHFGVYNIANMTRPNSMTTTVPRVSALSRFMFGPAGGVRAEGLLGGQASATAPKYQEGNLPLTSAAAVTDYIREIHNLNKAGF
jgi:hypothetical protein